MTWRQLSAREASSLRGAQEGAALFGRDDLLALSVNGRQGLEAAAEVLGFRVESLEQGGVASHDLYDAEGWRRAHADLLRLPDRLVIFVDRRAADHLLKTLRAAARGGAAAINIDEEQALIEVIGPRSRALVERLDLCWPSSKVASPVSIAGSPIWMYSTESGGGPKRGHDPKLPALPLLRLALPNSAVGSVARVLLEAGGTLGCHAAREVLRLHAGHALPGFDAEERLPPDEARGPQRCWVRPHGEGLPKRGAKLRDKEGREVGTLGSGYLEAAGERQEGPIGMAETKKPMKLGGQTEPRGSTTPRGLGLAYLNMESAREGKILHLERGPSIEVLGPCLR